MSKTIITDANLSTIARSVIVDGRRVEGYYDALVAHYSLAGAESSVITNMARGLVVVAYPGTDPARLSGKNKSDDQRWLDARAVRAGLVRAISRATEDTDDDTVKPVVLRVSLSGEGGGSTVVEPTHPLYASLVELLGTDN